MDPNETLAELRRLVAANNDNPLDPDSLSTNTRAEAIARLDRMCELVETLDNWVMGGGFLPTEWSKKGDAHRIPAASATRAGADRR